MAHPVRVALTRDFLRPDGSPAFGDMGLGLLDRQPSIRWEFLPEHHCELPTGVADQYDALIVLSPRVTAATLDGCRRLSLVARFGVGYDTIDLAACTRNRVLLTVTPEGVRRPVATAALALLLALTHRLPAKDRLVRQRRWADKLEHMGTGLTGRTLGLVGLGNIGRELIRLAAPLEMRSVAFDPYVARDEAAALGVEWLDLDVLLAAADFVVVCCPLTSQTHHLLDARRLALLKPSAHLVNIARGPIVDQAALTAALRHRRIAGAALDVFEQEPPDDNDPLLELDNVILTPHAICWTDELFSGIGRAACQSVLDVAAGRVPSHIVNREVLSDPLMLEKLDRLAAAGDRL